MLPGPLFRRLIATSLKHVAVFLTLVASSLAAAQAVAVSAKDAKSGETAPYRGSSISYGHQTSIYNYTESEWSYVHRIGLMPEWHFTDAFFMRARLFLSQELTLSNSTNHSYEVELSDLWVDSVWGGWKEPTTGIKVGGDVRLTLPTSKTSQAVSRLFTLAPSLNVSRSFKVLSGLSLSYATRFTWRFNRFSVRQNQGGLISNCNATQVDACLNSNTGARNIQYDLLHGPTVSFSPLESLNLSATFLLQHGWLSPVGQVPAEFANVPELQQDLGVSRRDFAAFVVSVTYTPIDVVSLSLTGFSFAPQLDAAGQYSALNYVRNTTVSLDAYIDIESTISRITKEKK